MKKIEENKVLYVIFQCLVMIVMAMIIWPLFDMLYCKFFTHSTFSYKVFNHVIEPIIFGIIAGTVFGILELRKRKKD